MVVYGEYLFLENCITGGLIVFFTGKLLGRDPGRGRLFVCGVLCGAYAFSLFLPLGAFCQVLGKAVFAAVVCRIAYGAVDLRRLGAGVLMFFAVTFLFGGVAIGFLNLFGLPGTYGAGGLYLSGVTYFTVTAASVFAALCLYLFVDIVKRRKTEEKTRVDVTVSLGERHMVLAGFIDSGNFLREPVTGRPVALVSRDLIEELLEGATDRQARYTVIPYRSVGVNRGMLCGYRMDALAAEGRRIRKPVLAVYDGDRLFGKDREAGQILLPGTMLERGIYAEMD